MRSFTTGCLLFIACGLLAASLPALEHGDMAPRGSIGYARVKGLSDGVKRLAGDDFMSLFDRALKTRRIREREDSDPIINEAKRFFDHANALEFALVDMMVRDPNVQVTVVLHLAEGAPKEFSETLTNWIKDAAKDDVKVSATEFTGEEFSLRLRPGFLVLTIGGAARNHVDDVLQGDTEESLSKVERFTRWSQRATSDIEMWLDMKAMRNAIDKLGEDFRMDRDMQQFLDFAEWNKWDTITGSASLPGKSGGGINVTLDVTFSQPLEGLAALLKPAGASRLVRTIPAETMGFLSVQLGSDADGTFTDIARMIHDTEMRNEPERIRRNLNWSRERLARLEERLKELEAGPRPPEERDDDGSSDKPEARNFQRSNSAPSRTTVRPVERASNEPSGNGAPEYEPEPYNPEQEKAELKAEIASVKEEIAEYEIRLRDYKVRPFSSDAEARTGSRSDGEEMYDELTKVLKSMGIDRAELSQVIGSEAIGGFVALPDPTPDALRDMFEHNWFVNVELRDGQQAVREKFINWMLGKALPEGATDEEKEDAKERAAQVLFKKVDGGEILRERGAFGSFCVYFGENLVGVAGSEEIALRVLKAASGTGGFSAANVPGGAVGSKLLYIDLAELLARIELEENRYSIGNRSFVSPRMDVRKLLKSGLRVGISTSETTSRITFTASTSGENSLRGTLETLTTEVELHRAWRHDENMLEELGQGTSAWLNNNAESLKALSAEDLLKALAAVNPQKLMSDGFFSPQDGMRSAFDPAMAARFAAMLEKGADELGGEAGPGDMSESGYEWFGLPAAWNFTGTEEYSWGRLSNVWLVCASKGNWVRGGRAALVLAGSSPRVVWLEEADFKLVRLANSAGRRLGEFAVNEPELPKWKVKSRMQRQRWSLNSTHDQLRMALERAKADGREFQLTFDGSREENALAKLREVLGIGPEDWFEIENAKQIEIEAKGEKFRIRMKQGDAWIEMDQDGNVTSSWDNE